MSRNLAITMAAIAVILIGGWFLIRPKQSTPLPTATTTPSPAETTTPATQEATPQTEQNLVSVTADGFSPKNITIKVGGSVTWTNSDSVVHTVNSALHPTHQVYPLLNLGNIQPGDKKSLTFPTAGIYKYHDHLNPSLTGQVTVE